MTAAPAPAPSPAPAPAPSPAPSPAPAPADAWLTGVSDEHKGYVQNKGWKAPGDVLESYINFEKLQGVPADRLVKLPGDDKPESWNPIYDRLGRPKEAKEYGLPVPEGADPKFAETAGAWFHKHGLSKKQAQGVAADWNAHVAAMRTQEIQAYQAKIAADVAALKTEWGAVHDQNVAVAKQASKALGFTAEVVDHLEKAMGFAGVMKLMHGLGAKMAPDSFVVAQKTPNFSGGMTPEQAKVQIAAKRQDTDFVKRLTSGDVAAKQEWSRLHQLASPGDLQL